MEWLKKIKYSIRDWFSFLKPPLESSWVEELPENLNPKTVYIVGEDNYYWYVAMKCPCNCGSILHMNLVETTSPKWRIIKHKDDTISLYPSIWRFKGCKSHSFLRNGKIHWVNKLLS